MASHNVAKVLRIIRDWQQRLALIAEDDAVAYAKLARQAEVRILRAVRAQGAVTSASQAQIMSEIRTVLRNGTGQVVRLADDSMLRILAQSIAKDAAALQAAEAVTPRVLHTIERFNESIRTKTILRVAEPYRTQWAAEWGDHWTPAVRRIQAEFSRGVLLGSHSNQIADAITSDLGTLNIAGMQDADVFARGFVRAKYTELNADFAQVLGKEAGLEQYVSIGVPDDRQSEVCFEASNAGPMTLEEWDASEWGRPPRHVFNCRCSLTAIPDVLADDDWSQPNEKFEEVAA